MNRILESYHEGGIRQVIGASMRAVARKINPPPAITQKPGYLGPIDAIRAAVPGWLDPGNVDAMEHAIRNLPSDNPILEIGSFAGLSSCVMSYLLDKYGKTNRIWCVDCWRWEGLDNRAYILPNMTHHRYMSFIRNSFIRNSGFFSSRINGNFNYSSDKLFEHFSQPLSFAYIDGDHTLEQSRRDFLNVDEWLEVGGFILFDDSADGGPFSVVKLMPEVKATGRYELVAKNPHYFWRKVQ